MNNFRELKVWQRSIDLASSIYGVTRTFPEDEKYGLASQLQRASVSVSANIAEGSGRQSNSDFRRFLSYSLGSLYEIESQLTIARNLKYLSLKEYELLNKEVTQIQKMTYALRKSL